MIETLKSDCVFRAYGGNIVHCYQNNVARIIELRERFERLQMPFSHSKNDIEFFYTGIEYGLYDIAAEPEGDFGLSIADVMLIFSHGMEEISDTQLLAYQAANEAIGVNNLVAPSLRRWLLTPSCIREEIVHNISSFENCVMGNEKITLANGYRSIGRGTERMVVPEEGVLVSLDEQVPIEAPDSVVPKESTFSPAAPFGLLGPHTIETELAVAVRKVALNKNIGKIFDVEKKKYVSNTGGARTIFIHRSTDVLPSQLAEGDIIVLLGIWGPPNKWGPRRTVQYVFVGHVVITVYSSTAYLDHKRYECLEARFKVLAGLFGAKSGMGGYQASGMREGYFFGGVGDTKSTPQRFRIRTDSPYEPHILLPPPKVTATQHLHAQLLQWLPGGVITTDSGCILIVPTRGVCFFQSIEQAYHYYRDGVNRAIVPPPLLQDIWIYKCTSIGNYGAPFSEIPSPIGTPQGLEEFMRYKKKWDTVRVHLGVVKKVESILVKEMEAEAKRVQCLWRDPPPTQPELIKASILAKKLTTMVKILTTIPSPFYTHSYRNMEIIEKQIEHWLEKFAEGKDKFEARLLETFPDDIEAANTLAYRLANGVVDVMMGEEAIPNRKPLAVVVDKEKEKEKEQEKGKEKEEQDDKMDEDMAPKKKKEDTDLNRPMFHLGDSAKINLVAVYPGSIDTKTGGKLPVYKVTEREDLECIEYKRLMKGGAGNLFGVTSRSKLFVTTEFRFEGKEWHDVWRLYQIRNELCSVRMQVSRFNARAKTQGYHANLEGEGSIAVLSVTCDGRKVLEKTGEGWYKALINFCQSRGIKL